MTDLNSRLIAYKYHKAFGKFSDDLFRLFGTERKKPHYVALKLGGQQLWLQPLDVTHRHELNMVELAHMGHSLRFPGTPTRPKVIARFAARGDSSYSKFLLNQEVYRTPVVILGQPFYLTDYSLDNIHEGEALFEFEHFQDTYLFSSHVQHREKARRLQKNFEPQTLFGSPQFDASLLRWRDMNNWSPRNRKRRETRKVNPNFEPDYGFEYDYPEEEFE